jgi:adenylate kinase family enzyme
VFDRIHILGASGSGTSTLGGALAERFGHAHLDTDDYFWERTDPPFQRIRDRAARQALLSTALDRHPRWVLSGSLCGWGDLFIPRFELVIFLLLPAAVRMERIEARERQRYGSAIEPGGSMHPASLAFREWAAAYDDGGDDIRSRQMHDKWLATLPCEYLRLEGVMTVADQIARVEAIARR